MIHLPSRPEKLKQKISVGISSIFTAFEASFASTVPFTFTSVTAASALSKESCTPCSSFAFVTENWKANNPILLAGQLAYSSDKYGKYKVGDGVTNWNDLEYCNEKVFTGTREEYEDILRPKQSRQIAYIFKHGRYFIEYRRVFFIAF